MKFGAHVSIADHLYEAIDRAVAIGCDAMQVFPGNPRGWKTSYFDPAEIAEFNQRRSKANISPLLIHLPYLVNLGSPIDRVFHASLASTADALAKAKLVGADYLVMHTGSHVGAGAQAGMERIKSGLAELFTNDFGHVKLLLENTSGHGHTLGYRLEQLQELLETTDFDDRLGICLDTCHAYGAGYDLATPQGLAAFAGEFDRRLGISRLMAIHANDSKGLLGSHLDRHEHIGLGHIGVEGWRNILTRPELQNLPFIIETPKKEPGADERNLAKLRQIAGDVRRNQKA